MSCHSCSCGSSEGSCHSHAHKNKGCGCSCHSCTCCSGHEQEEGCNPERLLAVADMAWLEVLKEKIKQNILASDHRIDAIAKIVGESNREYWQLEMAKAKIDEKYECKLSSIMDGSCSSCDDQSKSKADKRGK